MFYLTLDSNDGTTYYHIEHPEPCYKDQAGTLKFEEDSNGFNPGLFMKHYLTKLSEEGEYLFNRPQRPCKAFVLQSNPKTWFEVHKAGKNEVSKGKKRFKKL